MTQRIMAVVVTYNRLKLLKRAVEYIHRQTLPVADLIVVNNGSTDGTAEWLNAQTGITVVHQDNVGGSGGFYTGIKTAYEKGADWIWCMDDDVWPTDNCLETLYGYASRDEKIGIVCPKRLLGGVNIVVGETRSFNLTNPLRPTHQFLSLDEVGDKEIVKIEGMAFEGPLIKRAVVDKIGLPNKGLFIFYDDSDYSYRSVLAGFDVCLLTKAILNKEQFPPKKKDKSTAASEWKTYYFVRNMSYFNRAYGETFASRWFGGIRFFLHEMWNVFYENKQEKLLILGKIIRSFIDGKRKRLGKM